ncbi:MAG TPA: hypothetical protein PKB04_06405, partial [Phenylobacterium sp.]|nr:hypothetical protein [Phenylobacterium sp.]
MSELQKQALAIAPTAFRPAWPKRLRGLAATLVGLAVLTAMAIDLQLAPGALAKGFDKLVLFLGQMVPPSSGGQTVRILKALAETFAMAFAGTVIAALVALPLGIVGAKTVVRDGVIHFVFRRFLDIFRGVPALVWALILVSAFGLGPFAGVIALALADIPNLSKLFSESLENADQRPIEGVIKADDAAHLGTEVDEYVLTNEAAKGLEILLEEYTSYTNANGVWSSGFFGS